jgi:hypothetical protein
MEVCTYDDKTYARITDCRGNHRYKGKGRDGAWRELNAVRNVKLIAIIDSILLERETDAKDRVAKYIASQ